MNLVAIGTLPGSQYSFHADRFSSKLFASLWVNAWGEQYPVKVAPFSSCTYRLLQQLDQGLDLSPDKVMVDLGCGTGGVGLWLARKQETRLIGIDRCNDAIAIATRRASEWELAKPASFFIGDFCETGLATGIAHAVISIDAFTATQDIECALSEVRRILQANGCFLFTARELDPGSRHFDKMGSGWRAGLEENGFELTNMLKRPEVSGLWREVYSQWLKHEAGLRCELRAETVDGLVAEAHQGMSKMDESRAWYLIKASVSA